MKRSLTFLLCAVTIAGCGGATAAPAGPEGRDATSAAAPAAARDASSAEAPPSTVTLSRAARVNGVPIRMDVALLRRAGRVATLDLRLRSMAPRGGETFDVGLAFGEASYDVSGIYLMDPATGRKLEALKRDGECVCTTYTNMLSIAPGGTKMLTASFPAPSPAATTADVIVPHFGAFRDVPLRP